MDLFFNFWEVNKWTRTIFLTMHVLPNFLPQSAIFLYMDIYIIWSWHFATFAFSSMQRNIFCGMQRNIFSQVCKDLSFLKYAYKYPFSSLQRNIFFQVCREISFIKYAEKYLFLSIQRNILSQVCKEISFLKYTKKYIFYSMQRIFWSSIQRNNF